MKRTLSLYGDDTMKTLLTTFSTTIAPLCCALMLVGSAHANDDNRITTSASIANLDVGRLEVQGDLSSDAIEVLPDDTLSPSARSGHRGHRVNRGRKAHMASKDPEDHRGHRVNRGRRALMATKTAENHRGWSNALADSGGR